MSKGKTCLFGCSLAGVKAGRAEATVSSLKIPSLPFEFSGYCVPSGCVTLHSNTPLSTSVLGLSIGSCSSSVACGQLYKLCAEAYFVYVVSWNMLKLRRYLVSICASLKTFCHNATHILVFGFYRTSPKPLEQQMCSKGLLATKPTVLLPPCAACQGAPSSLVHQLNIVGSSEQLRSWTSIQRGPAKLSVQAYFCKEICSSTCGGH